MKGQETIPTPNKKIGEPKLESPQGMKPLPQSWQKYFEYVYKMMAPIKTYDQKPYEVRVDADKIKIKI